MEKQGSLLTAFFLAVSLFFALFQRYAPAGVSLEDSVQK